MHKLLLTPLMRLGLENIVAGQDDKDRGDAEKTILPAKIRRKIKFTRDEKALYFLRLPTGQEMPMVDEMLDGAAIEVEFNDTEFTYVLNKVRKFDKWLPVMMDEWGLSLIELLEDEYAGSKK